MLRIMTHFTTQYSVEIEFQRSHDRSCNDFIFLIRFPWILDFKTVKAKVGMNELANFHFFPLLPKCEYTLHHNISPIAKWYKGKMA